MVLSDATHQADDDSDEPQLSLVDQLAENYLKEENHLWSVIEKREDSTLQQIHDVHMNFLKRHYGESNILLSHSDSIDNSHKILSNINVINETSYDIAHEFFGHPNYTVLSMKALNGINLDKTFESIYELTVNSTIFWTNLQNVSNITSFFNLIFHTVNECAMISLEWMCISVLCLMCRNRGTHEYKKIIKIYSHYNDHSRHIHTHILIH